jgi:hypothetical protein
MSLAVNNVSFFEYQTNILKHLRFCDNHQKFQKAFIDDINYLFSKKIKLSLSLVIFFNQWIYPLKDKKIEAIILNKDKISEEDIDNILAVSLLVEAQKKRVENLIFNHLNPIGISFLTNNGEIYTGSNNDYEDVCFVKSGLLNLEKKNEEILKAKRIKIIAIAIVCRNEEPICDECYKTLLKLNNNMLVIRSNIAGSDIKINYLSKLRLCSKIF